VDVLYLPFWLEVHNQCTVKRLICQSWNLQINGWDMIKHTRLTATERFREESCWNQ